MSSQEATKEPAEARAGLTDLPFSGTQKIKAMKRRVLLGLMATGTVTAALKHAGLVRKSGKSKGEPQWSYWYWWTDPKYSKDGKTNKYDPVFVQAVELAQQSLQDTVRAEVFRRAIEGWEEPVFGLVNGVTQQVGTVRKYDSRLLQWLADHVLPEGRTPNSANNAITVNVDNRQQHLHVSANPLDDYTPTQKRWLLGTVQLYKELDTEHADLVLKQAVGLLGLAKELADVEAGVTEQVSEGAQRQLARLAKTHLRPEDAAKLLPPPPPVIEHEPAPEAEPDLEPARPGNLVDFPRPPE